MPVEKDVAKPRTPGTGEPTTEDSPIRDEQSTVIPDAPVAAEAAAPEAQAEPVKDTTEEKSAAPAEESVAAPEGEKKTVGVIALALTHAGEAHH